MAEPVSKSVMNRMRAAGLMLGACLAAPVAVAESLSDPTRPPAAFDRSQQGRDAGPVLQSVLMTSGRSEAIISGQTVRLGEKFGDAQLIRIAETEVVLRNGKELQTLRLFPNIEKRVTSRYAGPNAR